MRRELIAAAGAALLIACASASPPPGGPEDHAPPKLVRITPDTNAVNVSTKVVTFWFDETINDRGSGATELSNYFLVSPSDGNTHVVWHRSRIDVRPRFGFRPNTAYRVTLLPGLTDLHNNPMKSGGSVVFSTGPTIPKAYIAGVAFDWASERVAVNALVQAVTPDSITYLAQSDSMGHFSVGPLPDGSYLVRAVIDANGNHALDRNEAYDSLRVTVPQGAPIELLAIVRDTLPPHVTTVASADSLSLRVTFDRPLDPAALPAPSAFRLSGPDSVVIPIVAVLTPKQEQDSAKALADARADSTRRADSIAHRAPAPVAPRAAPPAQARVSVAAAAAPKPSVPAPPATLLLRLPHPLLVNTIYRLQVSNARSLSGRTATSERTFTTPKPPAPAAPDSTRRPVVTPRIVPLPPASAQPAPRPVPPSAR